MAEKLDIKKLQKKATKALKEASRRLEGAGKDARILVRKGEDELIKLSKVGRAQLEILALSLRKEQLYRQIGMKVWQLSTKGRLTTKKLKAFCEEFSNINKSVKSKKQGINKALKIRRR